MNAKWTAIAGILSLWFIVLWLHLTPALFAALITYSGATGLATRLNRHWPALPLPKLWGLLLLLLILGLAGAALLERTIEATESGTGLGAVMQQMAVSLEQVRASMPNALSSMVPKSIETIRESAVQWLRGNAAQIQAWGGHTLRGFGYVFVGLVIGCLAVFQISPRTAKQQIGPDWEQSLRFHFDQLIEHFGSVVFAQLRIATINTALTAVYLLVILPLLGKPLPLATTLVGITFIASLIPVLGNLISNSIIVVVSLLHSVYVAVISLIWLVAIHKMEYILNAHIIGARIRASAWELLSAMLAMEAAFGLAGLISSPVIYAQIKGVLYNGECMPSDRRPISF